MKKCLLFVFLLTSFSVISQDLIENCSPVNGNIQMAWYPMQQYTDSNSPGFIYTEGNTQGDPNIALFGFQIPTIINYNSIVTVSENFEITPDLSEGYSQTIIKEIGSSRNIYIRLKYGLPAGDYSGILTTTTSYFPENVCTYTIYGRVLPATANLDQYNVSSFKMFPNPANNILNFSEETSAEVYTIQGLKVGNYESVSSIDISQFASGIYLLKTPKFGEHKFIKK